MKTDYLLPYYRQFHSSKLPHRDSFSELIALLVDTNQSLKQRVTPQLTCPACFVENDQYLVFLKLLCHLYPDFYFENLGVIRGGGYEIISEEDAYVHQSTKKNTTISITLGLEVHLGKIGVQYIVRLKDETLIYTFTWNRCTQDVSATEKAPLLLQVHILSVPLSTQVRPGFEFEHKTRVAPIKPYLVDCSDLRTSYFLCSLRKNDKGHVAMSLIYSEANCQEQQLEYYDFIKGAYLSQRQPRQVRHYDQPMLYPSIAWQQSKQGPYATLSCYEPVAGAFSEKLSQVSIATYVEIAPVNTPTLIIENNVLSSQERSQPVWLAVTQKYSSSIFGNSQASSGETDRYLGHQVSVIFDESNHKKIQKMILSYGLFKQNKLSLGRQFSYQLINESYQIEQCSGLFAMSGGLSHADSKSSLAFSHCVNGRCIQYRPQNSSTQAKIDKDMEHERLDGLHFTQIDGILVDLFGVKLQHFNLRAYEEKKIDHLADGNQGILDRSNAVFDKMNSVFRPSITAQYKAMLLSQIQRMRNYLQASIHLFDLQKKVLEDRQTLCVLYREDFLPKLVGVWQNSVNDLFHAIEIDEMRHARKMYLQLCKKKSIATQSTQLMCEKSALAERDFTQAMSELTLLYDFYFGSVHSFQLCRSAMFEQRRECFMDAQKLHFSHLFKQQREARTLLGFQFMQEGSDICQQLIGVLMSIERLERRFLQFAWAKEYATDMVYSQKQQMFNQSQLAIQGKVIFDQVHRYLTHLSTAFAEHQMLSVLDYLTLAHKTGSITGVTFSGSAARGSALANDLDLKIFVKNDATREEIQELLGVFRDLILASTKRYVRADNLLLTLELMGPKGLPFNVVIFFQENKKMEYPPLYREDIAVTYNFSTAAWEFVHETIDYQEQSGKTMFVAHQQQCPDGAKIASVLKTQRFNIKRFDEPGAVLRVIRDMAYYPEKQRYNHALLTNIWQGFNKKQQECFANTVVLFLEGDRTTPPKIRAELKERFKSLVSQYVPQWEQHCVADSMPIAQSRFFQPITYFGVAAVIDKMGHARDRSQLEQILSDVQRLGIEDAVQHWKTPSSVISSLH